ncbi:MAG: branched-chain amino acid ABC transporter permease, partial [Pirellulales bacterium]|nr:branched-chain amino acid ABC transporter permease [Pirellulales bacterium]
RSVAILCAVIIGGLGSIPGTLVGVTILFGFDIVVIPWVDSWIQRIQGQVFDVSPFTLGSWRLALVGIALIVVMRFRPVGLIPSRRFAAEFQESQQ